LLDQYQRKFSVKVADRVLSEFSSDESDYNLEDFDPSGGVKL